MQKKQSNQRDFLIKFLEDYHNETPSLAALGHFTQSDAFKESYAAEVLAAGIPSHFENLNDIPITRNSMGRSSLTPVKDNKEL